jgi:hypothetical protein
VTPAALLVIVLVLAAAISRPVTAITAAATPVTYNVTSLLILIALTWVFIVKNV